MRRTLSRWPNRSLTMNAVIQSSDLLEWLSKMVSATASGADSELSGLVRLYVESTRAVFEMVGVGIRSRLVIPAKAEQGGVVIFSVRSIQMVAQGARRTITIAVHNGRLILTSNGIQVYASVVPNAEFPQWEECQSKRRVIVVGDDAEAYQMSIDITRNPSSSDTIWIGQAELGELYVSASCRSHVMCLFGQADPEAIPVMASRLQRVGIQEGDILAISPKFLEISRSNVTFQVSTLQAFEPDRHDQVRKIIGGEIGRVSLVEREILKLRDFLKVIVSGSDDRDYAPIGLSYESGHLFLVAQTKEYESHCAVSVRHVSGPLKWKAGIASVILLEATSYGVPSMEIAVVGTEKGVDAICAWFGQRLLIRAALRSNFPDPEIPAQDRQRLVAPDPEETPQAVASFEDEPA